MRPTKMHLTEFAGKNKDADRFLCTISEKAKKTGYKNQTIREWINKGKVDAVLYQGRIMVYKVTKFPPREGEGK